jgi:hypothetical protein
VDSCDTAVCVSALATSYTGRPNIPIGGVAIHLSHNLASTGGALVDSYIVSRQRSPWSLGRQQPSELSDGGPSDETGDEVTRWRNRLQYHQES